MREKEKNRLFLAAMAFLICGLLAVGIFTPDQAVSDTERRSLSQLPKISISSLLDKSFAEAFESYSQDQFPFREWFRQVKAETCRQVFRLRDDNGIYVEGGYAAKIEYPLREASVAYAASRFRYVYDRYLADTGSAVYVSVVPDKGYFLAEAYGAPALDYEKMVELLTGEMVYASYIDLFPVLSQEDYYATDIHWRQEKLLPAAECLLKGMKAFQKESLSVQEGEPVQPAEADYRLKKASDAFYGVYAGQAALPMDPDALYYLDSDHFSSCTVWDYEAQKEIPVYDLSRAHGKDPYAMFLGGSRSLLTIENKKADADRELVIFRDSFGSSLAPLLTEAYARITLVDIRYLSPELLDRFLTFHGQDVLFLYSTSVLNNSDTIR